MAGGGPTGYGDGREASTPEADYRAVFTNAALSRH